MSTLFGLVCLLFIRPTYSKQFSFTSGKCAFTHMFQKWVIGWWTSVWACTCVRMYVWVRTKRERASTVVCFVCVLPVRSHSHIKQMTRVSDLCFTTVIMVFPFSLQHILSSMRGLWFCVLVRRNSPWSTPLSFRTVFVNFCIPWHRHCGDSSATPPAVTL